MSAANRSLTVPEIARKVLELLGPNGEHWTTGQFARDAEGRGIAPNEDDAVCFCVHGAAMRVCGRGQEWPFVNAFDPCTSRLNDHNPFPVIKARLEELAAMDELPR